jgi:hypothetical protein
VSNPEMVFSLREGKEDVSVNNLIVELTINPPERGDYPVPAQMYTYFIRHVCLFSIQMTFRRGRGDTPPASMQ